MNDGILVDAKRGHTAQEVVDAVARLKQHGMTVVGVRFTRIKRWKLGKPF